MGLQSKFTYVISHQIYFFLFFLLLFNLVKAIKYEPADERLVKAVKFEPVNEEFYLLDDDFIEIKSAEFPNKCCLSKIWTVKYIGRLQNQYMRLRFTDLDIPLGSTILFLDSEDELLPDQPRNVDKSYVRKGFAFNGSLIKIVFKPVPGQDGSDYNSDYYSGFRIVVKTSAALPSQWDFWPTSDACQPSNDVMNGGILHLQDQSSMYDFGIKSLPSVPMHDCIWLFKIPPELKGSGFNVRLFLQLNELIIDPALKSNFEILVNENSSQGKPLKLFHQNTPDITNSSDPAIIITSSTNIYVHLLLPYINKSSMDKNYYSVKLGYGIYAETSSDIPECSFAHLDGFNCINPAWCVPLEYKCNGVVNCASYQDEVASTCARTDSDRVFSSVTDCTQNQHFCFETNKCFDHDEFWSKCYPESYETDVRCNRGQRKCPVDRCVGIFEDCFQACGTYEKKCPNGSCILTWQDCYSSCKSWERKCDDGSCVMFRCPEDECEAYRPFKCDEGVNCIYENEVCDGECQCADCSDENSCHSMEFKKFVTVFILCTAACVSYPLVMKIKSIHNKRKCSARNRDLANEVQEATPNQQQTAEESGPNMRSRIPYTTYIPIPPANIVNTVHTPDPHTPTNTTGFLPASNLPVAVPPVPPSYDEAVGSTDPYFPQQKQDDVPPPPYERVVSPSAPPL